MPCRLGDECCAVIGGRCRLFDFEIRQAIHPRDASEQDDSPTEDFDEVKNPKHYTDGDIQFIHAAENVLSPEEFKGFLRGNVLKYVWRCGKKGSGTALKDMQKAHWYMCRYMDYTVRTEGS